MKAKELTTAPKPAPRVMHVSAKQWITPNMIRVTCAADWIKTLDQGIEGAHFKLFLPQHGQAEDAFLEQLVAGPRPTVRTYTIRHIRTALGEIDVDFVDHGDSGPASAWARRCSIGDVAGFAGPGPVKLKTFHADFYVVAADMSALPVAAATLEAMPRNAKGVAYLEITSNADRQSIDAPHAIEINWLIHASPHQTPTQSVALIAELSKFEGTVQTCIAGESGMAKALREEIVNQRGVPKTDTYISGYWKIGMHEDAHQQVKRDEAG
jgi:NADPH-dependent ferric siderophore reductase